MLERYVLVVPSIFPERLAIAPIGVLGLSAFFGAFVLTVVGFLAKYPPVSAAQLELREVDMAAEEPL
jgi:hypothetical protein